ncbi:MAG: hypothetical protein COT13_05650 [Chloroflexi bacterium CG08_land_8_20_14_0_20_45_12]|nr:MAG: hypothetical protein AUK00_03700 [Dehalococcoidia bacterium CG2_30_46_9]PIU22949.1 MAG: hypothetical protein COT13_05650 [Chloroflexi bacterium CG08_land_8_20_14_0_20_45_12]PIX27266.1 MAG: hypothetical protein COZ67_03220 [Chloroflexi bacterium CG_4_8_14_3_um_filter_45_15]
MGKKKILVVDDEPNIRLIVRRLLGKDYIVLEANDGEEAVDAARKQKPDLILMDIMMPRMDGYSACHTIRTGQGTKTIPVVMLAAVGYELNKKLSKEVGASGYITKPFSLQDLLDTIGKFLIKDK